MALLVHFTWSNMTKRNTPAAVVLLLVATAGAGCANTDDPDNTANESDALRVAANVESAAVVSYVSAYFAKAAGVSMRTRPTDAAMGEVMTLVDERVQGVMARPGCASIVHTDATHLGVSFDRCIGAHARLLLSGSVQVGISFEAKACGPASCPVAVVYDVSTSGLALGAASIAGHWVVRDPLDIAQAFTWNGELDVTTAERALHVVTDASFMQDDDCVDLSFESTLSGAGERQVVASVAGMQRCMGLCATAGSVALTNADGATLTWLYDGGVSTTVNTESGLDFPIALMCTPGE